MKNLNSNILLRLGLGFVFVYAGISAMLQPEMWIGFVPTWVDNFGTTREVALYLHAIGDIILGILFLIGKWKKWVGLFGFVLLFFIMFINGTELLIVTFRDAGLAFAALAYAFQRSNNNDK